jgi:hypothetical protein
MAGIKNIQDLYKKVGEKGLREVLEKEIKVTEKFDAHRFAFEKNPHDYKIYFYGKNGKTPLSKIDRTVSNLYEAAIASVENLPEDIKKAIPVRHRFGFSWFPTTSPLNTTYERRPKKGLILTDITIRNRDRDVTRNVNESQIFDRWAGILGVEANSTIFEGVLDEATISGLLDLAKNNHSLDSLNESSVYTLGVLNKETPNVEALIFEADSLLFKITDNEIAERAADKRSHLFDILLLDICEFLNESQLDIIKPVSLRSDEAYIEVVSEVFNLYVETKGKSFLASGLERPKFLEKSGGFNSSWVKNPKTLSIIESDESYEYLYTVFLTNLKKPKYASGLLSEAVVNTFNTKIEEINDICDNGYSFLEFSTISRGIIYEDEKKSPVLLKNVKDKDKEDEVLVPNVERSVLLLHTFFNRNGYVEKKNLVDVLIINGAMPTNRLLLEAEKLHTESGNKIMLLHNTHQDKIGIEEETASRMLSIIVDEFRDLFAGYAVLKLPTLSQILNACESDYPGKISCESAMAEQLQLEIPSYLASIGSNGKAIKVSVHGDRMYRDCMDSLKNGQQTDFKKCMPTGIHTYWNALKSAYDKQTYY